MSLQTDLIFHVVSRRKWRDLNKGGYYKPENFPEKEVVECVTAENLNSFLNDQFHGRKNLLILVIDLYRLSSRYKDDPDRGRVHIMGGVNADAILDKIRIDCNKDGRFDVEVGDK